MNKKRVLITGANGFVGSFLCKTINDSYRIVKQVRKVGKNKPSKNHDIELNINSKANWRECLSDVNTIVHLAAVAHNNSSNQDYINEVNFKGTINLAKQSVECGVTRFIFISSIGVLGNATTGGKLFNENSVAAPHSQYSQSKLDAENELLKIAVETGLEVVIIRPVLVYGKEAPGNFGKLVKLVQKTPFLPFALCRNKRSFISVDNLVDFISVCVDHPKAKNETFCISDGDDVSIKEFTNGIAKGLSKNLIQIPIPVFIFKLVGRLTGKSEMIDQLVGNLQVDSSKAKELLDWTPPVTMAETFNKLTNT